MVEETSRGLPRRGRGGAHQQRLPGLDGLRTVAVVAVLLVHAQLLPGGFIGVDLFFVLSGFLITTLLLAEVDNTGRVDLVGFWSRRTFRLIPAVAAYLAAGVLAAAVSKPDALADVARNAAAVMAGIFNYVFEALGGATAWDGHLWSLSVEAQFYLIWPVALVVALRTGARRGLLVAGGVLMLAFAAWRAAVGVGLVPGHGDWYHSTDTRVDALIGGAVLAYAIHLGRLHGHTRQARRLWAVGAPVAWIALVALAASSPPLEQDPRWAYLGGLTVVSLSCMVIVAGTVLCPDHLQSRLLQSSPFAYVGRLSYAFYLWHYPVIFGLEPVLDARLTRYGTVIVAFVVTLVLAQVSMTVVERPAARLRPAVERWRPFSDLRRLPALNPVVHAAHSSQQGTTANQAAG